uniref:Uncharacterized protein n=1 Tax=Lygus hesperus TaxID=30085 RepID=A0A0A9XCA3_LYGHE
MSLSELTCFRVAEIMSTATHITEKNMTSVTSARQHVLNESSYHQHNHNDNNNDDDENDHDSLSIYSSIDSDDENNDNRSTLRYCNDEVYNKGANTRTQVSTKEIIGIGLTHKAQRRLRRLHIELV